MQTGCIRVLVGNMAEKREIGRFVFGLKAFRDEEEFEYQIQTVNENIPVEIILMQLKAFLNSLEKEYFDEFERGTK